jgi:diacylglycerol kinase family enzyme
VRTPYLLAGNSACSLNPMLLRTGGALSSLADGTFSLYLSRHTKRRALLWAAAKAAVGRIDLDRDFELLELDRCEVGSDRRMLLVAADGELYRMRPPLDCRIRPGLFRIIAPEGGGGEAQCPPRRTAR